jgi:transcriptional regulator with XRE-family HTH domain
MSRPPLRVDRAMIAALVGFRHDAGLTQRALARRAKRPQSWIAKIETGVRNFYLDDLDDMALAYRLPPWKFCKHLYERPELRVFSRLERRGRRIRTATLDPSWQMLITAFRQR